MGTLHYRMRVRTADESADLFTISSVPTATYPYILEPPKGDGETLDPITGQVSVGAYTVRVIDAPDFVQTAGAALVTDGLEYVNQAAAEAAGWAFTDTMTDGTITVGATDQVHGGTRSFKMATTNTNGLLAGPELMKAAKTYAAGDGIAANTLYRVRVWGRMNSRGWYDVASKLYVNGVEDAVTAAGVGAWQQLTVTVQSNASAQLDVSLQRSHAFVANDRTVWWDDLTIEPLTPSATVAGRVITSYLADANGKPHLLSRRTYLEETTDGGSSWAVLQAGYVSSRAMQRAATVVTAFGV